MSILKRLAGTYAAYKFIELLSRDFENWPAYKFGVIDSEGNYLLKGKGLTAEQKASYTYFHRLIKNLKRTIEKMPGGKTKIGKIATAYFLLREQLKNDDIDDKLIDETFYQLLNESSSDIEAIKEDIMNKPDITTPTGQYCGMPYFSCSNETYSKCVNGKRKTGRWQKYLGDDTNGAGIINYAKINPKSAILIQNQSTKTFTILRKSAGPNRWEYD
jgi:hypothetical protein